MGRLGVTSFGPARVFLLGASGFLGRNLYSFWKKHGVEVIPISRQIVPGQERSLRFESWREELRQSVQAGVSVSVVNCAAISSVEACERDSRLAREVNCDFAVSASGFCRELQVPFMQISSDGLFPNSQARKSPAYWSLRDSPDPVSVYGHTKLEAEKGMEKLRWGRCVRLSFVGGGLGTSHGLISFLAGKIRKGDSKIEGFTDVWFTPLHVDEAARRLISLIGGKSGGFMLHHWSSYPALTKYDFLQATIRAAGFHNQVHPVRRADLPLGFPISFDQSLESTNPEAQSDLISGSAQSLLEELTATQADLKKD